MPLLAQDVSFGFKGGLNLTVMDFSTNSLNSSNRAGYFVGPTVKFDTPLMGLSIDIAAFYDERHIKVGSEDINQQNLMIPANARLGLEVADMVGIYVSAGPQLGFNLGKSSYFWEDVDEYRKHYSLQETTMSFNLGAGVILMGHWEVGFYYNIPIGKTADFTWDTLSTQLQDQTMHTAKSTANAWRFAVSYYF